MSKWTVLSWTAAGALVFALIMMFGCTLTVSMTNLSGRAGSVDDDNIAPSTNLSPTLSIPLK